MAILTVTGRGQLTLRKEVLQHLGVEPGDRIALDKAPGGQVILRAQPKGSIENVFGILAGKTKKVATLEEIDEAIRDGWSGRRR
jgi:antitoxin PrlF